jgi:hypothetical protein
MTRKAFLDDLWRHTTAWAESCLIERGELRQMFVIHSKDENAIILPHIPHEQKEQMYRLLKLLCLARDAFAITSVSEAWMLRDPEGPNMLPSESERRQEVLYVAISSRDDETGIISSHASCREIERDADGKITGLATETISSDAGLKGQFAEVLSEFRLNRNERRAVEALITKVAHMFTLTEVKLDS